jgi:hypothetical protein
MTGDEKDTEDRETERERERETKLSSCIKLRE